MDAAIKAVKIDGMSVSCRSKIHGKYHYTQRPVN